MTLHAPPATMMQSLLPYRGALYDFDMPTARRRLLELSDPGAVFRLCHPFDSIHGMADVFDAAYGALSDAMPDLECRDAIRISGHCQKGSPWIGIMGTAVGTFRAPFLGIPPTRQPAHMRYHEFYRFDGGRIAEIQAIWDIPELMLQSGAWPMAPGLGREWRVPGPASSDGLHDSPAPPDISAASVDLVCAMLEQMKSYPAEGGPETMELDRFWHPRMSWYGPAGIGSNRGFDGFLRGHMKPWIDGMPDWSEQDFDGLCHFFGDGAYVGETGWPAMRQAITADGFRGIPPLGTTIDIRCLDFWRVEAGRIRENWVMVDLLNMYRQIGVDVMARMRAYTS